MDSTNYNSFLQEGIMPTLDEVLDNREKRVIFINKLLNLYPKSIIISFKLNIPGPVKNNETIGKIFEAGFQCITSSIKNENFELIYFKQLNLKTGPEYFAAINNNDAFNVKEKMTFIEENNNLGRLYDIDVIYKENENIHIINRDEIGYKSRKCFICNNEAKICSSRRTHSITEMYECIDKLIKSDKSIYL